MKDPVLLERACCSLKSFDGLALKKLSKAQLAWPAVKRDAVEMVRYGVGETLFGGRRRRLVHHALEPACLCAINNVGKGFGWSYGPRSILGAKDVPSGQHLK